MFMTKEELIQKLSSLEWEDFEVKKAKSELPKSVWETVSAFSNTNGGWIVLGVSEQGKNFEITGVDNAGKLEQDFLNTLRGSKFNVFVATKQEVCLIENKIVLSFYVPVHKSKPVYYNNQVNTFIRRGSADQRATPMEIDSMLRDQAFGTKTGEIAADTSRSSLNNTSLSRYRNYMSRFNPNVSYNRYDEAEFLERLRIMENGKCTFAGLLMFGNRHVIEKYFPDFRIDLLEVPGASYTNAKHRYTFRIEEQENLWEYYFQCFDRLKQKVDVQYVLTSEGFGQELSPGLESIREALVNMLMHTDYFSSACPRIRIFTNHIEFYNPGGLPKSFEELKSKDISMPRNPILAKIFRAVKLAENAGFGFDKMIGGWKAYKGKTPIFYTDIISTVTTFNLGGVTENVTENVTEDVTEDVTEKRALQILKILQTNRTITTTELAEKFNVTRRTIARDIENLKSKHKLKRIGSDKSGYWEVQK